MTPAWCLCNGKGTCYGCLIEALVLKHYGTVGLDFLRNEMTKGEKGGVCIGWENEEV